MSGAPNGLLDVAGTPSKGAQPGQLTRTSTRATKPRDLFVAENATTANKRAGPTYASAVGKQHKVGPAKGPEHKANAGAQKPQWPARMVELEKIPAAERQVETVHDRHAYLQGRTPQSLTDSNARVTEIPGTDNRPDINSLKLNGGTLRQRLDRFEEVRTGGGGNCSCWALASLDQINQTTHHLFSWYTVDAMRSDVAWKILHGDAQELNERLRGLWWDLESNPELRQEVLEQRKARSGYPHSTPSW